MRRFNQFFELTAAEKEKALRTLSEPERRQIEKTLQTFGSLRPEQRARCIRSFAKFASLSLEERQQFLKNAERWKLMSPERTPGLAPIGQQIAPAPAARLPPPPPPLPPPPGAGARTESAAAPVEVSRAPAGLAAQWGGTF